MTDNVISTRPFCILSGLSGVIGVALLVVSFLINAGPPQNATSAELIRFGQQNYAKILWGAWLQAVGPVLIVLFAFSLVHLARATHTARGDQEEVRRQQCPAPEPEHQAELTRRIEVPAEGVSTPEFLPTNLPTANGSYSPFQRLGSPR